MDPFEADSYSAQTGLRTHRGALEACALCALTLALGIAARPEDPLAVTAAFPWPVFAVVLVGLRYGFPLALLSAGLLHFGAYMYAQWSQASVWPLPFEYSVGFAIEDFSALRFVRDQLERTGHYVDLDMLADPDDPRDLFGMVMRSR